VVGAYVGSDSVGGKLGDIVGDSVGESVGEARDGDSLGELDGLAVVGE
jgi:hypothetical protein